MSDCWKRMNWVRTLLPFFVSLYKKVFMQAAYFIDLLPYSCKHFEWKPAKRCIFDKWNAVSKMLVNCLIVGRRWAVKTLLVSTIKKCFGVCVFLVSGLFSFWLLNSPFLLLGRLVQYSSLKIHYSIISFTLHRKYVKNIRGNNRSRTKTIERQGIILRTMYPTPAYLLPIQ